MRYFTEKNLLVFKIFYDKQLYTISLISSFVLTPSLFSTLYLLLENVINNRLRKTVNADLFTDFKHLLAFSKLMHFQLRILITRLIMYLF